MEELKVLLTRAEGTQAPSYATACSSGMDLQAFLDAPLLLNPLERALVPTGLFISLPEGCEAQVRPRSGLAHRYGVTVLNAPGTIDADYRGEIKVLLVNLGKEPFTVKKGDRIAQIVFQRVLRAHFEEVAELPDTERGQGGFGSTG